MIRDCGECTLCCRLAEVKEGDFFKKAGTMCKHCDKSGCGIFGHNERPSVCKNYQCAWSRGFGSEDDRPDKSGVMISISKFNGGVWIFVQEARKNASITGGKNIILDAVRKLNIPAIVSDFDTKIGEDYGEYIILTSRLEPTDDMPKAKKTVGEHICSLSYDVNMYKLNI